MTEAKDDLTYHASIDSLHVLDPRKVRTPIRFEGDVCLQFSVFAIQSVELRVPLDANKPSNPKAKTRSCESDDGLAAI